MKPTEIQISLQKLSEHCDILPVKAEPGDSFDALIRETAKIGNRKPYIITKKSLDMRAGHEARLVLNIDEPKPGISFGANNVSQGREAVIVGFGPAGMFAALKLIQKGIRPVIFERGPKVEDRSKAVEKFWSTGELDENANVQFGEGGAGTFSDGKLTTLVREKNTTGREVLETFVHFGAPEDILWDARPHIGTDILKKVVRNIRIYIENAGGEIHFNTKIVKIICECGAVKAVEYEEAGEKRKIYNTNTVLLGIGHSARDTFRMLAELGANMEQKPFSVGLRVQHPQEWLNRTQYGRWSDFISKTQPADYKLSYHSKNGRGVYTFCMCPGGYVVNASSQAGGTVTNGMSDNERDSEAANSALLVNITPEDYSSFGPDVLAGAKFQRSLEEAAFRAGQGALPTERMEDFLEVNGQSAFGNGFEGCFKGAIQYTSLRTILPRFVYETLKEGIVFFDSRMHGFADPAAVLSGIESRTSSPVRILRNAETFESNIKGLYPIGEGAGYAGGIMSAAIDGLRCADTL